MAELTPFATVQDLTNFWKAPDNSTRAEYLLKLASNRLRLIAENNDIDLDAKAAASPAYKDTLQWVVMEAVKRALQSAVDAMPMESYQQTAGPYSENIKYTNPTGDLFYRRVELQAIGLTGTQTLSSISTTPNNDIYLSDYYS